MRTCTVDECDNPLLARKMCSKHYCRYMKYGDPHYTARSPRAGEQCEVDECGQPVLAKRLCGLHYGRARRTKAPNTYAVTCSICGTDTIRLKNKNGKKAATCGRSCAAELRARTAGWGGQSRISVAVRERDVTTFLQLIRQNVKDAEGGCWEWQGFREKSGYGNTRCNNKTWYVHRLVASMVNADWEPHLAVHHACANRACCNPDHLQVVTAAENAAEMFERNSYLRRIAKLEAALVELDPTHPLVTGALPGEPPPREARVAP